MDWFQVQQRVRPLVRWQDTETARVADSPENVRWLAERQAGWLRADRAVGGGRLLLAQLTRREIIVQDEGAL